MSKEIFLYGVGDVLPEDPDPDIHFQNFTPILSAENALSFGQLEGVLTNERIKSNASPSHCACDPSLARAMKNAGFDIVSFAGNHSVDYGPKSFLETLDHVTDAGLIYVGAGRDEDDARTIRYIEKDGVRFAFLAYCSILPYGSWAERERPGVNPARGLNAYEAEEPDQPGTHIKTYTFPHPRDLQYMIEDIKKAKANADIVVVSIHWGIHVTRAVLADYQRYYAHFAIDAGADIILGHHAHTLKPIEVYKGKAIFYSLGNAALGGNDYIDHIYRPKPNSTSNPKWEAERLAKGIFRCLNEPIVPGREWHLGWYQGTIAKCTVEDKKIKKVSFIPTFLDIKPPTLIPKPGSDEFDGVVKAMREITAEEKLDTVFEVIGEEVLLPQTVTE